MKTNFVSLHYRYYFNKIIITLILLVSFAFSIAHSYAFAFYDQNHCSVSEYINEIKTPVENNTICDIHFEYHQVYILPQIDILIQNADSNSKPTLFKESYQFLADLDFTKPPIS